MLYIGPRGGGNGDTAEPPRRVDKETVRLRPLWYAPVFNGVCWFPLILIPVGVFRLITPVSGQLTATPCVIIAAGTLPFALLQHTARSPGTFLELSRTGIRRSVWGRVRLLRWDEIERFRILSHPRTPSWLVAELRAVPSPAWTIRSGIP